MEILPLQPIPFEPLRREHWHGSPEAEGFIDEAKIADLIARTSNRASGDHAMVDRPVPHKPSDEALCLMSSELDFAGFSPTYNSPFRNVPNHLPQRGSHAAAAAPPVLPAEIEPGLEHAHCGGHRWWLLGCAGAVTTTLFAILFFHLAQAPQAASHGQLTFHKALPEAHELAQPKISQASGVEASRLTAMRSKH